MIDKDSGKAYYRLLNEYFGIWEFIEQQKLDGRIPQFVVGIDKNSNIFTWYFLILGPEGTAHEGGQYIGQIIFPENYPILPPISIRMLTPSGCFLYEEISLFDLGYSEWKSTKMAVLKLLEAIVRYIANDKKGAKIGEKVDMARNSLVFNQGLEKNGEIPKEVLDGMLGVYQPKVSSRRNEPITPIPLPKRVLTSDKFLNPALPQTQAQVKPGKSSSKISASTNFGSNSNQSKNSTNKNERAAFYDPTTFEWSSQTSDKEYEKAIVHREKDFVKPIRTQANGFSSRNSQSGSKKWGNMNGEETTSSGKTLKYGEFDMAAYRKDWDCESNKTYESKNSYKSQVIQSVEQGQHEHEFFDQDVIEPDYNDDWGGSPLEQTPCKNFNNENRALSSKNSGTTICDQQERNKQSLISDDEISMISQDSLPAGSQYDNFNTINGQKKLSYEDKDDYMEAVDIDEDPSHYMRPHFPPPQQIQPIQKKSMPRLIDNISSSNNQVLPPNPNPPPPPKAHPPTRRKHRISCTNSEKSSQNVRHNSEQSDVISNGNLYQQTNSPSCDTAVENFEEENPRVLSTEVNVSRQEMRKISSEFNDLVFGDLIDLSDKPNSSPPPLDAPSLYAPQFSSQPGSSSYSHSTSSNVKYQQFGMVVTSPMGTHDIVQYIVYVDRKAPLFYIPKSLCTEPKLKPVDIDKWRKKHSLEFGDGLEFNAEFSHEYQAWLITEFVRKEKLYLAKHEDGMNLIKTVAVFDNPDSENSVQCFTSFFGMTSIKKIQTLKALANVAYDCWLNLYVNGDLESEENHGTINLDLKVAFHSFESVSTDERGIVWDTPWARYFDKLPPSFSDDEEVEPWNLEKNAQRKLDIITGREGILLGNKIVYCPSMTDSYIQLGLEPESDESYIGQRIEMDMFFNNVIDSYVVYFYVPSNKPSYEYKMSPRGEPMLEITLDLTDHYKGFYIHMDFGYIDDENKLLGVLPMCNRPEKIKEIQVFIKDKRFERFSRFSIGEISKEAKKMLEDAKDKSKSLYPQIISVPSGIVFSGGKTSGGKVYADDYPHLIFVFDKKFWKNCQVGNKIRFKAEWKQTGATYEIYELSMVDKMSSLEKMRVMDDDMHGSPTSKYYFKLQVTQSKTNPTIFEAGEFGIIEDRDFTIGQIKAVKPSLRKGLSYNAINIIAVEDLAPKRLTYLKVVQKCDSEKKLADLLKELLSEQTQNQENTNGNYPESYISQSVSRLENISPNGSAISWMNAFKRDPLNSHRTSPNAPHNQANQENSYYWPPVPSRPINTHKSSIQISQARTSDKGHRPFLTSISR